MGMIKSDLETMTPSFGWSNQPSADGWSTVTVNFQVGGVASGTNTPLVQSLTGSGSSAHQRAGKFLHSHAPEPDVDGRRLRGGYLPRRNYFNPLYRFSLSTNVQAADPTMLFNIFLTNLPAYTTLPISPTNPSMSHLMDGVVDLRVRAYDPGGHWMTNVYTYNYDPVSGKYITNISKNVWFSPPAWGEVGFYMFSNTLPASVEINLGVLEDRAIQRAQSLSNVRPAWAQSNYLAGQRRPGACLPPARLDPQR